LTGKKKKVEEKQKEKRRKIALKYWRGKLKFRRKKEKGMKE